jgi:ABC-type multidrug transport system fused ATPase/permease subunit
MVELQSGNIQIDGVDIHDVGLDTLRTRLALVPQDSTLFLGTLRDNLWVLRLSASALLMTVCEKKGTLKEQEPMLN